MATAIPGTTYTLSGTLGSDGWYKSPVTITFNPSSPGTTYLDQGFGFEQVFEFDPPFIVQDGTYALPYYHHPTGGSPEPTNTVTFKIDRSAPTFKLPSGYASSFSAPSDSPCKGSTANRLYGASSVTVDVLTASENPSSSSSGLVSATFEIFNGTVSSGWKTAAIPTSFTFTGEGNHTIRLNATDKAGNDKVTANCLWIDATAPTVTATASGSIAAGAPYLTVKSNEAIQKTSSSSSAPRSATVTLTAPNTTMSTVTLTDTLDTKTVAGTLSLPAIGVWKLNVSAKDEAGNAGWTLLELTVTEPPPTIAATTTVSTSSPCSTPCDLAATGIKVVFDPGSAGHVVDNLRLGTSFVSPRGAGATTREVPTGLVTNATGVVTAWFNGSRDVGSWSVRVLVYRPNANVEASAWTAFTVGDKTAPTISRVAPDDGSEYKPGLLTELTARWSDAGAIDRENSDVRLERAVGSSTAETLPDLEKTGTFTDYDFNYRPSTPFVEGNYTWTITLKDVSGNSAVKVIKFKVDKNAGASSSSSSSSSSGTNTGNVVGGGDCVGGAPGQGATGGCTPSGSGSSGSSDPPPATTPPADEKPAEEKDLVAPAVTAEGPMGVTTDVRPLIFADYSDPAGVVAASVVVELDGARITGAVTNTSFRFTPEAPLEPGHHIVNLRLDDRHGNQRRVQWAFVVSPPPVLGKTSTVIRVTVPADQVTFLDVPDRSLGLRQIGLQPTSPLANATLHVEKLEVLPVQVGLPPGEPALLINAELNHEAGSSSTVGTITLTFALPERDLAALGANAAQVLGLHHDGTAWRFMTGGSSGVDDGDALFQFETDSLSPLALVIDVTPPEVAAAGPRDGAVLTAPPTVAATVSDAVRLARAEMTVNDKVIATTGPEATRIEATPTDLPDGQHKVVAKAVDSAGNEASASWAFLLDRAPPVFPDVKSLGAVAQGKTIKVDVRFSDAVSGVDLTTLRVLLDGKDVTASASVSESAVTFTPTGTIAAGNHTVVVKLADKAGNAGEASVAFSVTAPRATPVPFAVALAALGVAVVLMRRRD